MATTTPRKVLIGVDASQQAENAFNWYVKSLHQPQNEVIVLHVVEIDAGKISGREMHIPANTLTESLKKEQTKSKALEIKFIDKITQHNIRGSTKTEVGTRPGEVICELADREAAAMIVVGTRGLGVIRRTIMGSVSDYVIHHCHCPVVVYRE